MFNHTFLISIIICFSATFVAGSCSVSSSNGGVLIHVAANLDSAIQIIENDSFPENRLLDCEDVLQSGYNASGVYEIFPRSRAVQHPIKVYCDMETDGGGWTVIQRRGNFLHAQDYFYQDWQSYKQGFGKLDEDFWLGNDNIFGLSNQKQYSARFDLRDFDGNKKHALYDSFWIDGEKNKYMLHIADYSGDAGDSMADKHNGMKFSTKDRRNDNSAANTLGCAPSFRGGWWYNSCFQSNLNGLYYSAKHLSQQNGIMWRSWKELRESLEWTEIKIRRNNFK